ncbi:hypothetical protein [Collimonas pratensis]|uniref:hypothetical protein n=1 Tax=Collimonas pratensis TaxID=279113 RepID=UPI00078559E4|nr:hypothetical protein [Collimonas pratensis]
MIITLSPQRREDALVVSVSGDALTINDEVFDFSVVPDGAELPADAIACGFITGSVERIAGVLHLTLVLPHGADPSPHIAFPTPIINPPDGLLEFPQ